MELNKIIGTIKKNEIENKIIDFFGEDLREKNFYFKKQTTCNSGCLFILTLALEIS